jgi:dTDP-D-glucose 4,6-dehydratase
MKKVLTGDKLFIHADPTKTQAGKRHYLHARNAAAALLFVINHGKIGERYNVVGEIEYDNLQMAKKIEQFINEYLKADKHKLNYELVDFHSSRPGHDLRYALDGSKLEKMGYSHPLTFEESLRKTVFWTMDRKDQWLFTNRKIE